MHDYKFLHKKARHETECHAESASARVFGTRRRYKDQICLDCQNQNDVASYERNNGTSSRSVPDQNEPKLSAARHFSFFALELIALKASDEKVNLRQLGFRRVYTQEIRQVVLFSFSILIIINKEVDRLLNSKFSTCKI